MSDISIHAPLRERLQALWAHCCGVWISIHAPLRERPFGFFGMGSANRNFNPRSLAGATGK